MKTRKPSIKSKENISDERCCHKDPTTGLSTTIEISDKTFRCTICGRVLYRFDSVEEYFNRDGLMSLLKKVHMDYPDIRNNGLFGCNNAMPDIMDEKFGELFMRAQMNFNKYCNIHPSSLNGKLDMPMTFDDANTEMNICDKENK